MAYAYTVTVEEQNADYQIKEHRHTARSAAISQAKEWADRYSDKLVYISFFRSQDGQHGYINPDGADICGKSWTTI